MLVMLASLKVGDKVRGEGRKWNIEDVSGGKKGWVGGVNINAVEIILNFIFLFYFWVQTHELSSKE